jgi:hypothetical protein
MFLGDGPSDKIHVVYKDVYIQMNQKNSIKIKLSTGSNILGEKKITLVHQL